MNGSDGREKQRSSQASVPEPVCFSSKDAGCYEDIVSIKKGRVKALVALHYNEPIYGPFSIEIRYDVENLQGP